jgi:hypothetical protein
MEQLGATFIMSYLADITKAVKGAKDLETVNAITAKNIIAQYGEVKRIIGDIQPTSKISTIQSGRFAGVQQEIRTTGTLAEMTNGKFVQFGQTTTMIGGQIMNTTGNIKDLTGQFSKTTIETEKANKNLKTMFSDMSRLAIRAALTIPIWQALRGVMDSTTRVFTDGFKDILEESLALVKIKNTLQGTTAEITSSLEKIKTETQALALESGISQDKIIATFQKFSSVGLDVATAMTATNAAIKLGVITQTDATASAESLAHAFSVLINANASAGEKQKQVNDIIALTAELWKTNGFNIEEFTGSLEKFSITSKSVNFTTSQTLALLATLSKSGLGSAGNLLRNSIGQLLVNLDKLAGDLGVKVNPELDNTFSILMKVLGVLNDLQKTNNLKGLEQAKTALKDVFGGTRSAVPITALASLYDVLQKNLTLTGDMDKFNNKFKDTENALGNVVARFHTANKEIGEAFVSGLLHEEEFGAALNKYIELLKKIETHAKNAGKAITDVLNPANIPIVKGMTLPFELIADSANIREKLNKQIADALKGTLPRVDLTSLFNTLLRVQTFKIDIGVGDKTINTALASIKAQLLVPAKELTTETEKQSATESKALPILLKKADFLKLEGYLKKELSALGLSEVDVEQRILAFRTASGQFLEKDLILQKELVMHAQAMENIELRRSRAKGLVDTELDLLRASGATTSQVIKYQIEREKSLGIGQRVQDQLNNEIELNKAITKEKSNQNKISSDSVKLFQIAQKYGIQTATAVSEFITGKTPLRAIEPGGQASELMGILKEFFASELEQRQAQQFLFEGRGAAIPIPERQAIQDFKPLPIESIKLPDINTQIGQINVEIKKLFKQEDTSKQIIDSMLAAIRENVSVKSAIDEQIENF